MSVFVVSIVQRRLLVAGHRYPITDPPKILHPRKCQLRIQQLDTRPSAKPVSGVVDDGQYLTTLHYPCFSLVVSRRPIHVSLRVTWWTRSVEISKVSAIVDPSIEYGSRIAPGNCARVQLKKAKS